MHVQPTTVREETPAAPSEPLQVSIQHACARLEQPFILSLLSFWRLFLMRVILHMRQPAEPARNVIPPEPPETTFGIARYRRMLPSWIELVRLAEPYFFP